MYSIIFYCQAVNLHDIHDMWLQFDRQFFAVWVVVSTGSIRSETFPIRSETFLFRSEKFQFALKVSSFLWKFSMRSERFPIRSESSPIRSESIWVPLKVSTTRFDASEGWRARKTLKSACFSNIASSSDHSHVCPSIACHFLPFYTALLTKPSSENRLFRNCFS